MASDPISWGKNTADREAKQALQAQQLLVIPNLKPLYLPEEKHNYYKREHNHKEIGYENRVAMSFANFRAHSYRHLSGPTGRH